MPTNISEGKQIVVAWGEVGHYQETSGGKMVMFSILNVVMVLFLFF